MASRPTHAGRTDSDESFPLSPKIKIPNLHIVQYTCQFEQYLSHRQNERRAHPSWAPTKEPTMSCWRYSPSSNQDHFQDLLEAICPDFLAHNFIQITCYSNKPQLLSAEVVLCMHKTTILCQFGLFCHQLTTISPSILNHFWWELYHYLPANIYKRLSDVAIKELKSQCHHQINTSTQKGCQYP